MLLRFTILIAPVSLQTGEMPFTAQEDAGVYSLGRYRCSHPREMPVFTEPGEIPVFKS